MFLKVQILFGVICAVFSVDESAENLIITTETPSILQIISPVSTPFADISVELIETPIPDPTSSPSPINEEEQLSGELKPSDLPPVVNRTLNGSPVPTVENGVAETPSAVRNDTLSESENGTSPDSNNVEEVRVTALQNLRKVFGIAENLSERNASQGPAPEFMIELYNTITDSYGVTRAKNPYDAHVVRSFSEKESTVPDYFHFNISLDSLGENETILEAELHIHRMETPHGRLHPSLYLTPFCILSLYQVTDPKNLAIPDLHHLLGVHYVPALGFGWEVFNVKQPVLKWMSGQPNHGFLVAATSLGGDRVPVQFARRSGDERVKSKQPILVLFTQDSRPVQIQQVKPRMAPAAPTTASTTNMTSGEEEPAPGPNSSLEIDRFHHALLYQDSVRHPNSVNRFRSRRSKNQTEVSQGPRNFTSCGRRDLFVSFEAIGWSSWIISPKGYNAFYCDGLCSFPLDLETKPSNHATVQSIVHELNLVTGMGRPCCVPTTLLPISLLFYDEHGNVVLKQYVDMVADTCGCL